MDPPKRSWAIKLSILVPCYNEENTVLKVLKNIKQQMEKLSKQLELSYEVIVINDGSTDKTSELVGQAYTDDPQVKLIHSEYNGGKGHALKLGIEACTGQVILIQDADLEYDPGETEKLIGPILSGQSHVVYGTRFKGSQSRVLYFWHYLGNKLLTFISNILTNVNLSDMEVGHKAFAADILKNMIIESSGFEIEVELTAKIAKLKGIKIFEVPVSYNGRTYAEGKKVGPIDGFKALYFLAYFNLFKRLQHSYTSIPDLDANRALTSEAFKQAS